MVFTQYPASIIYRLVTNTPLRKSAAELDELQLVTTTFVTSINSHMVDFFPVLGKLPKPLQFWRKHLEEVGAFHYVVFRKWWSAMKALDGASWVRDSVINGFSGDEDRGMYLTLSAIAAGADNPRMTMNAWVMACLAYPEAMQKAREEVENLCGAEAQRLPGLDDLPNLSYVCAVVKEVLRWRPTVPWISQRVLVEDLDFEGYRFPAGTEFLVNAISVCSNGYASPEKFCPGRWLENNGEPGGGIEQDLWHFAFSGGRRSCVGYKLAQKEMFVAYARLLYCFDIYPAGDFDDQQLNAFSQGEPFPVKVSVRGPAHVALIRQGGGI